MYAQTGYNMSPNILMWQTDRKWSIRLIWKFIRARTLAIEPRSRRRLLLLCRQYCAVIYKYNIMALMPYVNR